MANHNTNPEYGPAKDMMELMVRTSQRPEEGNQHFVESLSGYFESAGISHRSVVDPVYTDRSLLIADFGDPEADQSVAAISHSDVVGVGGQDWEHNPWELHEEDGKWFGRGVCDTHGSGVAMLLAGMRPDIQKILEDSGKKVSVIFTYDEEAISEEFSMRGARMAAGLLGEDPVVTGDYFIAGEPTEIDGKITPMRGHKGRFLASFLVNVAHSGHVSDIVQNALMSGANIVHELGHYSRMMKYGSGHDDEAQIFNPPHTTLQVSAADVKSGDFSTTPSKAKFTLDMRTLPYVHDLRVEEVCDLITNKAFQIEGAEVELEIIKDAVGSLTPIDSPIVSIAEAASGQASRGFNGGDEGRIMRTQAGLDGVTLGPGKLSFAHMPNEQIDIDSIFNAADIYGKLFAKIVELEA